MHESNREDELVTNNEVPTHYVTLQKTAHLAADLLG
jgi:hypothetical protein